MRPYWIPPEQWYVKNDFFKHILYNIHKKIFFALLVWLILIIAKSVLIYHIYFFSIKHNQKFYSFISSYKSFFIQTWPLQNPSFQSKHKTKISILSLNFIQNAPKKKQPYLPIKLFTIPSYEHDALYAWAHIEILHILCIFMT